MGDPKPGDQEMQLVSGMVRFIGEDSGFSISVSVVASASAEGGVRCCVARRLRLDLQRASASCVECLFLPAVGDLWRSVGVSFLATGLDGRGCDAGVASAGVAGRVSGNVGADKIVTAGQYEGGDSKADTGGTASDTAGDAT